MKITPKVSSTIQGFIHKNDLFKIKDLHEGVVHIGFPQEIAKNIHRFRQVFEEYDVDVDIYLAHKATRNRSFVKQAYHQNIKIDVASKNELLSALDAGFTGDRIEATGPKNNSFLKLALEKGCLISLDSQSELERLINIKNNSGKIPTPHVLIRLNNLQINGRNIQVKNSRFGINSNQLGKVLDKLKENNIDLKGFHFHADGYDPTMRAGFLEGMFDMFKNAYQEGFTPSIINIGGAFRDQTLENYRDWSTYIEQIEHKLINQESLPTWADQTFGLIVNKNGKISGKEKAMSMFYKNNYEEDIHTILSQTTSKNRPIADILSENMITLSIEPGYALLQQSGISLVQVIETKEASDGRNLVVLDGNIYNLGLAKMFHYTTDPILIPQKQSDENSHQEFQAFVVGNLCREDDFLINRLINFTQEPQPGDLLIFTNTAAYFAGFEDASPIMHPTSKFLVVSKTEKDEWIISTPENYIPVNPVK